MNHLWGRSFVLSDGVEFKLKMLIVYPGRHLSLQRHRERSEFWVIDGECSVFLSQDGVEFDELINPATVEVQLGWWHMIVNSSSEPIMVLELQHGSRCHEDDIERRDL